MQDSVINITEKISEDVKDEAEDVSSADGSYQIKPSLQAK